MHAFEFLILGIVALTAGLIGYTEGKARGWRDGVDEAFKAFLAEGFNDGWLARHYGQCLKDERIHPDEIKRLMPTLFDPSQELSDWKFTASHLPFDEYRAQKIAKVNAELEQEKKNKQGHS